MKRLEAHGWKVGSAEEFLSLSEEEKVVMTHAEKNIRSWGTLWRSSFITGCRNRYQGLMLSDYLV